MCFIRAGLGAIILMSLLWRAVSPAPRTFALVTAGFTGTPSATDTATSTPTPTNTPTRWFWWLPFVIYQTPPPTPTATTTPSNTPLPTQTPTMTQTTAPRLPHSRRAVMLVFGQSNAGNFSYTTHSAGRGVFVLNNGVLRTAIDPLPGAEGKGGSMWPMLGDLLISSGQYDEIIFVPVVFAGSEIAKWTPEMPIFQSIRNAAADVSAHGWQFTHLLWLQGESDNALNTGYADYQLHFRNMLGGIRGLGVGAPVFVASATRCAQFPANNTLRGAQQNLVNHAAAIWAGPDLDVIDADGRIENCHFNDAGQQVAAQLWRDQVRIYDGW